MEWVETTGRSVEEALDAALDQLGVHEDDVEFEVLEEPKVGLFGRLRGEARLRARVRPTKPRPKEDRRDKRRKTSRAAASAGSGAAAESSTVDVDLTAPAGAEVVVDEPTVGGDAEDQEERQPRRSGRSRGGSGRGGRAAADRDGEDNMSETGLDVPILDQGEVAATFLRGVVERFGVEATVVAHEVDEDTVEVRVEGGDLGLLIGPKGATLASLQELARTVVQRKTSARNGRLLVDVSGYRQRRKEALEKFARTAAEKALSTGTRIVLEPMSAADRKIIHDTINDIEGVATTSEGEEPRRRVVLLPEATQAG